MWCGGVCVLFTWAAAEHGIEPWTNMCFTLAEVIYVRMLFVFWEESDKLRCLYDIYALAPTQRQTIQTWNKTFCALCMFLCVFCHTLTNIHTHTNRDQQTNELPHHHKSWRVPSLRLHTMRLKTFVVFCLVQICCRSVIVLRSAVIIEVAKNARALV